MINIRIRLYQKCNIHRYSSFGKVIDGVTD